MITALAVMSGLLQVLGYFVYIRKSLRHEVEPNAATWFMFAYGTAALTLLEWDQDASWQLLVLPVTCALLSIVVAVICFRHGTLHFPKDWVSRGAFLADVLLTVGYVCARVGASLDYITDDVRNALVLVFIVLSNSSTFVSFVPLLKGAWDEPEHEHVQPWLIWASAYTTLGVLTYLEQQEFTVLLLYPVSCALLHALAGLFALRVHLPAHRARHALDT